MNKKLHFSKEQLLSILRKRNDPGLNQPAGLQGMNGQEFGTLLDQLQIFQLELEMQNEELAESHSLLDMERIKFEGFFDDAPVGYFILDYIGTVEQANRTGIDLLHVSKSSILNKRFQSFIDPQGWELFYTFLHKMQTTSSRAHCELKLLLADQQQVYTRMEGVAIHNPILDKLQYYLTVIDISESKAFQQQILDTSHRLEMTLNASGTGTWKIELVNSKLFLDDYSLSLLEINPWEFDGTIKGFIALMHPEDQLAVRQKLLHALYNFKKLELEFRIILKNKHIKTMAFKGRGVQTPGESSYYLGIVMDITLQKELAEKTHKLQQEKQRLILSTAFSAQEKERNKISTALHDSVCQVLYGIRMNLQSLQSKHELQEEFKQVNSLLDQAIRETRELSYELTPSVLLDFGFTAGVREMALRFSTARFKIYTHIKKSADLLNQDLQLNLFRMIQELISNCIKYAEATEARIMVCTENDRITMTVSDNGSGFKMDPEKAMLKGSGLRGIKHRIYLLNGELTFKTGKQGTAITIVFKNEHQIQPAEDQD